MTINPITPMTLRQIETILKTKNYRDAAHEINRAFRRNEIYWMAASIALGVVMAVVAYAITSTIN